MAFMLAFVLAQSTLPTVSIKRDDTNIIITNRDPSIDAVSRLGNKNCIEEKRLSVFYGPNSGFVETITNEAKLTSSIVFIEEPNSDEKDEDKKTLEMFGGSLEFADRRAEKPLCPETIERSTEATVTLEQGRTTVKGVKFFLDEGTNIGTMDGPIDLQRQADGDSPSLNAKADKLDFNVDTDLSTLSGNVTVTSEDRVSTADELEFDEKNGIAIMKGSPARSTQGNDFVEGEVIKYFLNNNDVVVIGGIAGEIEVDQ
jgi:lipopolysaccharide export system protein LptA